MMTIIDSHAHVFHYLGGRCGFKSEREHLDEIQRRLQTHFTMPVRRKKDNKIVEEKKLWNPNDRSISGKYDVNFRVSRYGRFEWTKDGVDYYIQFLPPTLQYQEASPEFLKVMMEHAGIDKAVLQCGIYGKLNNYYLSILKEYPEIFIPLYRPNEKYAYTETEIEQLKIYVKYGFKGICFTGNTSCFELKYKPFWDEVQKFRLPIFWSISRTSRSNYEESLRRLIVWSEEYGGIDNIIAQSFPLTLYRKNNIVEIPDFIKQITKRDNIYFELALPISEGGNEDYPFPESRKAIEYLYNIFGGNKFVWGTDIPNVERFCTYAQSLNYIKDYCNFISKEDMALILGNNLVKILKL